jgi:hypothetical protein
MASPEDAPRPAATVDDHFIATFGRPWGWGWRTWASRCATAVHGARIKFRGRTFRVPKAFADKPVGVRPAATDGIFDVCYRHQRICATELDRSDV